MLVRLFFRLEGQVLILFSFDFLFAYILEEVGVPQYSLVDLRHDFACLSMRLILDCVDHVSPNIK